MLDILITWRDQDPFLATKNKLRRYLEDTSMMDAAALLRQFIVIYIFFIQLLMIQQASLAMKIQQEKNKILK